MGHYYFLASLLPPLRLGNPPELSFSDLVFYLRTNLHHKDLERSVVIRRYYDLLNLRLLWLSGADGERLAAELDRHGNLDEQGLEEALITHLGLPDYVYDYMERYESREDRLSHFAALLAAYYKYEIAHASGFLREYLIFERDWRLVLTGFRAKQLGRDRSVELQYEDSDDDIVRQLLAQRDADHYEPPVQYRDLKEVFEEHSKDPLALHQALCLFCFDKIEGMLENDIFSIDRILGYMAQLIIVEKWMELDQKKGLQIIDTIVKEAS